MEQERYDRLVAELGVPRSFAFRRSRLASELAEPVALRGVVQAANKSAVYLSIGPVVLELPVRHVVDISHLGDEPSNTVEVLVNAEVAVESRMQFVFLSGQDVPLPTALQRLDPDWMSFPDKKIDRNAALLEKLRKLGVRIPERMGADGGTTTYSYLSSATGNPDGGRSDSDPIRTADD